LGWDSVSFEEEGQPKPKFKAVIGLDVDQHQGTNACSKNNGNCSHMCIPSPNFGRFCACPEGMTPTGDDSTRCHVKPCKDGKFRCGNGYCIDQSSVCDGFRDCHHDGGSDEANCKGKCPKDRRCDDGECLRSSSDRCNGFDDCHDRSDEKNCDGGKAPCPKGFKSCDDGQCIMSYFWCDRDPDCRDKSDEKNCNHSEIIMIY